MPVPITGQDLDLAGLLAIARHGDGVELSAEARDRISTGADVVARHLAAGHPLYGVTTGLGSRSVQPLGEADAGPDGAAIVRGRAAGVGAPLPAEIVRAAIAVRLNTIATGGAGASLELAAGLAALLNAGVTPVVPESGSVGAADLCLMAHVGLVLLGEGEAEHDGSVAPAGLALEQAGLAPVALSPRDGLAICASTAISVSAAALATADAELALIGAQAAAGLSLEGFAADLGPLDPRVSAARPAPGQAWAAAGLLALLAGGELTEPGRARRLQDPLSLRGAGQVHGALRAALDLLAASVSAELNASPDSPLVLDGDGRLLTTANFIGSTLALALDATAIAIAQTANASAARCSRLAAARLTDLPEGLAGGTGLAGVAPLEKTAQALALEIRRRAAPVSSEPVTVADGVEDLATGAAQAALRVRDQIERLRRLLAVELIVAAQAVDLAPPRRLGAGTEIVYLCVRELVTPLGADRPLAAEIERVARDALGAGELARRLALR